MQRIKLLGLAILAVFALSAVVSATAFGSEISVLSKAKVSTSNLKFSGTSKKETVFTILNGFAKTKCPEVVTEGQQEGTGLLGTFHLHWKGCTTNLGGTCTGLNDTAEPGTILALGTFHLVYDKLGAGAELGVAMLFLLEHVHYTCEGGFVPKTLVLVLGEVLCLVKPVGTLTTALTIGCEGNSGDPLETTYWKSNNGEEVKMGTNALLGSQNEGAFEMSAQSGEGESKASEEFEIMG
jgi:hypothetical protein